MAEVKKVKVENSEFENQSAFGKRYSAVMLKSLRNAPTTGMTVGGMKEISEVIDVIEKAKDDLMILLTPAQLKVVLKKTREIPWLVFDKELITLDDYLGSL